MKKKKRNANSLGSYIRAHPSMITVVGIITAILALVGLVGDLANLGILLVQTPTPEIVEVVTITPEGLVTQEAIETATPSVIALAGTIEALEVAVTVEHAQYSAFATAVAITSSTQSSGGLDVNIVVALGGLALAFGGLYLQWRKDKREQEVHENS